MRHFHIYLLASFLILLSSCAENRIHEKKEWETIFKQNKIQQGCFMFRDHTHDAIYYFNKDQALHRYLPASTFKIFTSLVALETAVAADEKLVIKWDGIDRNRPEWNEDLDMREAFKRSAVPYFQELARRIGKDNFKHYLDTVQYGNRNMGGPIDMFWLNDSLQISADEQLGMMKRLYFEELPFSERSQRIVRSIMLREETPKYKLYYKTGTGNFKDSTVYWVVGFVEKMEQVKEHEKSMNKADFRNYPYMFAQNFVTYKNDTSQNWYDQRIKNVHDILKDMHVIEP